MELPPLPNTEKISYQVSRDILIRIWWRRTMLRPRRMIPFAVVLLVGVWFLFLGRGQMPAGVIFLLFLILMSIFQYWAIAKAIDNDRTWTDPKTLEFTSSQLVLTGPDWKSEMPWTRFKGFSEDATYFYLHLSDSGIASVIPKSAFSAEQQQLFRQYAQQRSA